VTSKSDWNELLQDWKNRALGLSTQHGAQWEKLWLPPVSTLGIVPPDPEGLAELQGRSRFPIEPEIIKFYQITDGWSLWLGSFLTGLCRVGAIDLFAAKYPDAAREALHGAPLERRTRHNGSAVNQISHKELSEALVASEPDSREFVLLLPSGETCLYLFDSVQVYPNFYGFMVAMRDQVLGSVEEMLLASA
jgi:hypothetical protein